MRNPFVYGKVARGESFADRERELARLLSDEILERVDGAYEFTDVFFKRWLRREFIR